MNEKQWKMSCLLACGNCSRLHETHGFKKRKRFVQATAIFGGWRGPCELQVAPGCRWRTLGTIPSDPLRWLSLRSVSSEASEGRGRDSWRPERKALGP